MNEQIQACSLPLPVIYKAVNLTALFHHLFSDVDFVVCTIPTCVVTKESFNSIQSPSEAILTTITETTTCNKQNIQLHRCLLSYPIPCSVIISQVTFHGYWLWNEPMCGTPVSIQTLQCRHQLCLIDQVQQNQNDGGWTH